MLNEQCYFLPAPFNLSGRVYKSSTPGCEISTTGRDLIMTLPSTLLLLSTPSPRVLKVFLSRTAQRTPYMTSWRVLRLLVVILLVVLWFLVAWTSAVCQNPELSLALIAAGLTPEGLQFSMCLLDRWDYMMSVGTCLSFQYLCTHVSLVLVLLNTQLAVGVFSAWVRLKIKFSLETLFFGKHRRQDQVVNLPGTMRDTLHLLVVLVNAKKVFILIFRNVCIE